MRGRGRQWVSLLVVALGLIHVLSEVLTNGSVLVDLARSGVGGLPTAPDNQVAAFYSLLFGVLAAAAGQVMFWGATRFDALPLTPGFVLVAVGICGAFVDPSSPFWAAIVLGVLVIIAFRRSPPQAERAGTTHPLTAPGWRRSGVAGSAAAN